MTENRAGGLDSRNILLEGAVLDPGLVESVSGEGYLLVLQTAIFSLCLHVVGRESELLVSFL
jgi:hypothetical protein